MTNLQLKLILVFLSCVLLSSCASPPLKAPCNHYARFCGSKTPVNQW